MLHLLFVFNMLGDVLFALFGDLTSWQIIGAMVLTGLYYSASEVASFLLVARAVHTFEGLCCRNAGDTTAYSEAASQETNWIAMVERQFG